MRNKIRDAYDDDEDENTIKDGQGVRVRMTLMDGRMREVTTVINARDHQPHFGTPTELESFRRQTARQVMIDRAENAWRTAGFRDQQEPDDPPDGDDDDTNDRQRARSRYLDELTNAWRTPPRMVTGFGPAAVGAGPDVVGAGPTRPVRSSRDAEAVRDAAWKQYCDRICNAWKTPR